ncbi:MAG: GGDEF domain-containing protein [Pseudomonadota bacterium]
MIVEKQNQVEPAEMVLSELKRMGIPASPECYEVWYSHRLGHNKYLSNKLDASLKSNNRLTEHDFRKLHDEFCKPVYAAYFMKDMLGAVASSAAGISSIARKFIKNSSQLNIDTASAAKNLQKEGISSVEALEIVTALSETMQYSMQRSKALEQGLSSAIGEIQKLKNLVNKYESDAHSDALTEIWNRRYFDKIFAELFSASKTAGEPLSLIIADIDHFKAFNDTWGHNTGDQALKYAANVLKSGVTNKGVAARYGGEEFAILLRQTGIEEASEVAECLRRAIGERQLKKKNTGDVIGHITMSFGVASSLAHSQSQMLFAAADKALYQAKANGRNCVAIAPEDD